MGDDEAANDPRKQSAAPTRAAPPGSSLRRSWIGGTLPYSALLCDRTSWNRSELDELVRRQSLMPSGTLDKINEWAYERFDDPILEEDSDSIRVHSHLVVEPS